MLRQGHQPQQEPTPPLRPLPMRVTRTVGEELEAKPPAPSPGAPYAVAMQKPKTPAPPILRLRTVRPLSHLNEGAALRSADRGSRLTIQTGRRYRGRVTRRRQRQPTPPVVPPLVLNDATVKRLFTELQSAVDNYKTKKRLLNRVSLCVVAVYLTMVVQFLIHVSQKLTGEFQYGTQVCDYFYLLILVQAFAEKALDARISADAISRIDDVRLIGPLIEATTTKDPVVVSLAERALMHLLPRMQASDSRLLNENHREVLNRTLRSNKVWLVIAILKAYEQVGDPRAIPYVERLAKMNPWGDAQRRIRQAAMDCLPYLQGRAESFLASQTLLRASSAHQTEPEHLLRPATTTPNTAPEQLLRPGGSSPGK